MAAATVATLFADSVVGDIRKRKLILDLAADADTYTLVGATQIFGVVCNPPSTTNVFASFSGNVVTFNYAGGGAMAGVSVEIDFI